ncbi:MAG: pyridoxamine 5'-phosphate oxidase family protein [Acidimicrobiales bacterium]
MNTGCQLIFDVQGLQILDEQTCWRLVDSLQVGRIAFVSHGNPIILPVNHRVDGDSVAFRSAEGSKLTTAILRRRVAFEVDDWSAHHRSGWSVVVSGVAMPVTGGPRLARLEAMGLEPWANAVDRTHWICIRADAISGRRTPPKP